MGGFKHTYNFYSALVIIVLLGVYILYLLRNYLDSIFIAIILAFLTYPIYEICYLQTKNKTASASIVIIGIFLLILIPLSLFGGILLNYISNFDLSEDEINEYENAIFDLTGIKLSVSDSLMEFWKKIKVDATQTLPQILSVTSNFLLAAFIMFFILFYLLIEKSTILKYVILIIPFSNKNSMKLLNDSGKVIKAVLIGQVLTAVIQGTIGMFLFIIAGVSGAFFWGIVMIILSLIPIVGAFLVWLPVGLFLLVKGQVWQGILILAGGALIVSQIDNIIRPKLVGKFADIHPIETMLGVFMGIASFGIIGIILGPLLFSLFKILINIFIKEYIVEL